MKYLLVFLAVFGLTNASLTLPQSGFRTAQLIHRGVALKDGELADIIKILSNLLKEAVEAVGADMAQIISWVKTEWKELQPYIQDLNAAIQDLAKQLNTDLRGLGEAVAKKVLKFIADHSDTFNQLQQLVEDAADKLQKGDTDGVEADIKKMLPLIKELILAFNAEVKADIPAFIAWVQAEQETLAPLVQKVVAAGVALAKQVFADIQDASDAITAQILQFLKDHQQEIINIWKDVAAILKSFGIDVNVPTDLTPAINDLESLIAQVKALAIDFQPFVEDEIQAFVAWVKAEEQKMQPMFNLIKGAMKAFLDALYTELQKVIGEALDDTAAFFDQHDQEIHDLFHQIVVTVNDFLQGNTQQGIADLKKTEQMFDAIMAEVKVLVVARVKEFIAWFKAQMAQMKQLLPVVIQVVQKVIKEAVAEIGKESQDLASKVEGFFQDHQDLVQKLHDTIQLFLKDLGFGQ